MRNRSTASLISSPRTYATGSPRPTEADGPPSTRSAARRGAGGASLGSRPCSTPSLVVLLLVGADPEFEGNQLWQGWKRRFECGGTLLSEGAQTAIDVMSAKGARTTPSIAVFDEKTFVPLSQKAKAAITAGVRSTRATAAGTTLVPLRVEWTEIMSRAEMANVAEQYAQMNTY